jgi:hypothetical protein
MLIYRRIAKIFFWLIQRLGMACFIEMDNLFVLNLFFYEILGPITQISKQRIEGNCRALKIQQWK